MRQALFVAACAALVAGLSSSRPAATPSRSAAPETGPAPCSSCSAHPHLLPAPDDGELTALLARYGHESMRAGSEALETLLYHGARVRGYLARHGDGGLDGARRGYLDAELRRDRAVVSLRIVDQDGVERGAVADVAVPLGIKRHLHTTSTCGLQEHEFSGSVVRVGVRHLWARF